jgi:hypothetical protein
VDFTLALAKAQVAVTATPALMTTTNGSLAGLVTGQQAQELPLNGRRIAKLVMMQLGMNLETHQPG